MRFAVPLDPYAFSHFGADFAGDAGGAADIPKFLPFWNRSMGGLYMDI